MEISVGRNTLRELEQYGQSVWIDLIRRGMITSGELAQLIEEDGVSGVTSNPSIFEKAIAGSRDYDGAVRQMALEGKSVDGMYRALVIEDIRLCADALRPVFDRAGGDDGFVSLEVAPGLAHDTRGTIEEARSYWSEVNRPNLMIKVPATSEGIPAIRELTADGINVNVTLLFGLPRYREVAEAYIAGLEDRVARNRPIDRIASVASFFLSRIDVLIDPLLEEKHHAEGKGGNGAASLLGKTAIASAKLAYSRYKEVFGSARFRALLERGARRQRLLWASTSTKNPAYSDVRYVEPLIGPETVNTMPLETLHAFRDHGVAASRLTDELGDADRTLRRLAELGIDLRTLTERLEQEGEKKFIDAYNLLMDTLSRKRAEALAEPLDRQRFDLAVSEKDAQSALERLRTDSVGQRLWRRDPTLWSADRAAAAVISHSLGWLHVPEKMEDHLRGLSDFSTEVRASGIQHVVLLGMGGSSLAPLVFQRCFPRGVGGLPLSVIDTTDPATILGIERSIPIDRTLFIVASKSGTTAEPLALGDYFFEKVKAVRGESAGRQFAAITDPGTPLAGLAESRSFRKTFENFPDIGGRYSAFSFFGLVPAMLMGVNVEELLIRALRMSHACSSCVPPEENPGLRLGAVLGALAAKGRNKLTILMRPELAPLGMWLEQLIAESTGKNGTGILPVAGEPAGSPELYGADRLFVDFRLRRPAGDRYDERVDALRRAGHPVVRIVLDDILDIGQEFFRWEIATAIAGHLLGINAFDEPDVQNAKENTNRLLDRVRSDGSLPSDAPDLMEGGFGFYGGGTLPVGHDVLKRFLGLTRRGDYVAIMAYLPERPEIDNQLETIRTGIRDRLRVATTVGYGPRFLHSTGQFHKGGPATGVFLQLTAADAEDAPVPGQPFTFGTLKRAQALGDFQALRDHGRRVLRIHIGGEPAGALARLATLMAEALPDAAP